MQWILFINLSTWLSTLSFRLFSSFLHQIFHDVTITLALLVHTVNNRLWELRILPTEEICLCQRLLGGVPRREVAAKQQFTSHQGLHELRGPGFYSSVKCSYGSLHGAAGQHSSSAHANLLGPFGPVIVCVGLEIDQRWGSVRRMELSRAVLLNNGQFKGGDPFCEQVVSLYSLKIYREFLLEGGIRWFVRMLQTGNRVSITASTTG